MPFYKDKNNHPHFVESAEFAHLLPDGCVEITEQEAGEIRGDSSQQDLIVKYEAALDDHLDSVARAHRYRDRVTFALRAGYPNPWQAEGVAFGSWMDACNFQALTLLNAVVAGEAQLPTIEDFIGSLPEFVLP